MKNFAKIPSPAVALAAFCLLMGVQTSAYAEDAPSNAQEVKALPVTLAHPQIAPVTLSTRSVGTLKAKQAPTLKAQASGEVMKIFMDEGDRVQPNALLAQLDDTDYQFAKQSAQADIERVEALLKAQKLQVQRLKNLVLKRSTSQAKLDEAEAQYGALVAQKKAAQVRLQQAQRQINHCKITSPIAADVAQRQINRGDFIAAGTPLFKLVNNQVLQAQLPLPERLLSQIKVGQNVRLSAPHHPEQVVQTQITAISPEVDPQAQSFTAIAEFNNAQPWKAGNSIVGDIVLKNLPQGVWVPEQSVVLRPQPNKPTAVRHVVYVAQKQGEQWIAKAMEVKVAEHQNGRYRLLTPLSKDAQIVVTGAGFLSNGAPIQPAKPAAK
jgi:RND family efflux transporter MFP subunit